MDTFLAKNIKYLREKNNMGQQELADILNIPRSTLACWESNLRTPRLEQIVKIAEYFKTNLDIIYRDFENNVSPPYEDIGNKRNYKQVLKDKGLMDENDNIDEESLNTLLRIADIIEALDKKKDN